MDTDGLHCILCAAVVGFANTLRFECIQHSVNILNSGDTPLTEHSYQCDRTRAEPIPFFEVPPL